MDNVEILILARLRGQLAVINRHDDARPLDCRSAGAQPQILHRPDLRQIPGAVLQLIDFFLQCIAFLFRLQKTGRQLLDTLVGQRAAVDLKAGQLMVPGAVSTELVPSQGQSAFVWAWLGALGQATNLRFLTGVTPPGWRYHPAVLAQAAATLEAMYPGRFALGLGAGTGMGAFGGKLREQPAEGPARDGKRPLFLLFL